MTLLFWFCFLFTAYTYLGYPALVRWGRRPGPSTQGGDAPPSPRCTVLMVGHNEAANLPGKVYSLLESSAAGQLDEIIYGDDGSDDGTEQVWSSLISLAKVPMTYVRFDDRKGKPTRINALMTRIESPIVVLTDARQPLASDALERLLAGFHEPENAVISGELIFRMEGGESAAARGMDAYWRYEKFIRKAESRWGRVPGASGAFYAIQRACFHPIPENTLLDDVAIPMLAMTGGKRCCFAEGAVVYDRPSISAGRESIRKRRTLAGNLQLLSRFPSWILPGGHPAWWAFLSHKIFRLLVPFALIGMLVGAGVSQTRGNLVWAWVGQGAFYLLAALGGLSKSLKLRPGPLAIPFMFVSLNAFALLAWYDALGGKFNAAWDRRDKS